MLKVQVSRLTEFRSLFRKEWHWFFEGKLPTVTPSGGWRVLHQLIKMVAEKYSTETNQMTVADGLTELKRIDKLLSQRQQEIVRYASKKKGSKDEIENQRDFVKDKFKSAQDLIKRYNDVKIAIQQSNIKTTIHFENKNYTIAEGLLLKQGLFDRYDSLFACLNNHNGAQQVAVAQQELNMRGKLPEEAAEKFEMIPELLFNEVENMARKEELLNLRSYIDALIEKSNHHSFIEIK
ncbi:hypothetical protein LCGC14_0267650 [marine sediment metagenome]|uniref:Uncharacterized protein n=1 Tax=marine sediment metagenome TaxID=412755 RepID=A0A0F9U4P9_9ZZZZ